MHRPANGIRPLLEAHSEAGYRGPLLSLWRIMRRLLVLLLTAFTALSVTASSASTPRFEGYVGGAATGKGHHFVVGDGLNLVFVDRRRSFTGYRVCWHRLKHAHHRCWLGETGRRGRKDRIFVPAPPRSGRYIVKWTVRHRREAIWTFYNGVGD